MIWVLFAVAAGVALWNTALMRTYAIPRERGQPVARVAGVIAALLLAAGLYAHTSRPRAISPVASRADESRRLAELRIAAFNRTFKADQAAFDRKFATHGREFDADRDRLDWQQAVRRREAEERRREFDDTFERRRREHRREFEQAWTWHKQRMEGFTLSDAAVVSAPTTMVRSVDDKVEHERVPPTAAAAAEQ